MSKEIGDSEHQRLRAFWTEFENQGRLSFDRCKALLSYASDAVAENARLQKALDQAIECGRLTLTVTGNIGTLLSCHAPAWLATLRPELADYLRNRSETKQEKEKKDVK